MAPDDCLIHASLPGCKKHAHTDAGMMVWRGGPPPCVTTCDSAEMIYSNYVTNLANVVRNPQSGVDEMLFDSFRADHIGDEWLEANVVIKPHVHRLRQDAPEPLHAGSSNRIEVERRAVACRGPRWRKLELPLCAEARRR
jgi:hypothetical protein